VIILGHRGAREWEPDNTVAALVAALRAGAAGSEFDVRLTADGRAVCAHDAALPDGRRICDLTAAQLRDEAVTGPRGTSRPFAFLDEALAELSGSVIVAEAKNQPWDPCYDPDMRVAHVLASLLPAGAIVACFDPATLAAVRALRGDLRTAVTTTAGFDADANLTAALAGGHEICSVEHTALDKEFVARAHAAGREVYAWATDEAQRVRALAAMGVDGLMSDNPSRAIAALRAS
jgi:glycerophosphoryl diester phosphodiesterase